MKIAVTGAGGLVGKELVKRGCIPIHSDITLPGFISDEIKEVNPDVLIHCAALTDVGYCEKHFKEAFDVNVRGTSNVVTSMPKKSVMIYISSDHVFAGENWFNQGYGEWHKPQPTNTYGFTKWGGELALHTGSCRSVIVRTSRGYSYEIMKPTITLLKQGQDVVFTNLIKRSFMYLQHFTIALMWLAENIMDLKDVEVINISGESVFSYSTFWGIVREYLGLPGKIIPRNEKIEDYPRPFRAGLDTHYAQKLGVPLGSLSLALKDLKENVEHDL